MWAAFIAAIVTTCYVHGLKHLLESARPAAVLPLEHIHVIGPILKSNAFPSGHSATAMMLAGLFWLYLRSNVLKIAVLILFSLVVLSRIMVGAHWPLDVVAGALGGWIAAFIGAWLSNKFTWGVRTIGQRTIALMLFICTLYLLFFYDTDYPGVNGIQSIIAIASLFCNY